MVNVITEPGACAGVGARSRSGNLANSPVAVQACLAAVNAILAECDPIGWRETERALGTVRGVERCP